MGTGCVGLESVRGKGSTSVYVWEVVVGGIQHACRGLRGRVVGVTRLCHTYPDLGNISVFYIPLLVTYSHGYRKQDMPAVWTICICFEVKPDNTIFVGTVRSGYAGVCFNGKLGVTVSELVGSAVSTVSITQAPGVVASARGTPIFWYIYISIVRILTILVVIPVP